MNTMGDFEFDSEKKEIEIKREFEALRLSALPKNSIRQIVSNYNTKRDIGEENIVLNKVVEDIEALNIHRTSLNCLTLLKISEKHFDESPINRTKMIEMFLFVLFAFIEPQTDHTKPDVKDCEYVLGYFCEQMIKNNTYEFSKDYFLETLELFCSKTLIDVEIRIVFNILFENRIIVNYGSKFKFKVSYWIHYFVAKRMHADNDFYKYMLDNEKYISFTEVIEFYTGIERNCIDIIEILTKDLSKQCDIIENKTGLIDNFNLFDKLKWNYSETNIEEIKQKINKEVKESKLPDSLKDEYADKDYNFNTPYNQEIRNILKEFTFLNLDQKIKASSRALRNSDYVDVDAKKALFREITRGLLLFSKILFLLTPFMAKHGSATFDGLGFILVGFDKFDFNQKIIHIILRNPSYVVERFKDDLFSKRYAPLLYDAINSEKNKFTKHVLILLLIFGRPREWTKYISNYIQSIPNNSAYLEDILDLLLTRYKYDYASKEVQNSLIYLSKMCLSKYQFKGKKVIENIKKITNNTFSKIVIDE